MINDAKDLSLDQQAMVMWLYFVEKFKTLPAREKVVLLCGFCEAIDSGVAKKSVVE